MSASVTNALLKTLQATGYAVETRFHQLDRLGDELAAWVDVTCTSTGERWIVRAPTGYDAVVEAVRQIGFDLEE